MERMIQTLKEELRGLKLKISAYEASGAIITVNMDSFIESGSTQGDEDGSKSEDKMQTDSFIS